MADHTQAVADAIFAKSNVLAVVGSGKLTAIYPDVAKTGAVYPYGVFFVQAPEPVTYTFGPTAVLQGNLWTLKVITDSGTGTISPQKHANQLLANWMTTLGNTLTVSGATVAWMEVVAPMPPYQEKIGDVWVFHRGTQLRIRTE